MRYFVTGGSGFIGAYLVRDLLQAGHEVTIYELAPQPEFLGEIVGGAGEARLVRGDVTDFPALLRAMREAGAERVVHLASLLTGASEANPLRAVRVNVEGTLHAFEAALAAGAGKVVWASSIAAFGRGADGPGEVLANDAPHAAVNLYGAGKSFLETAAAAYRRDRGLDAVGLRFTIVYGYGKSLTVERGSGVTFLEELIDKPALGEPSQLDNGDDVLDFSYVEDCARAIVLASEAAAAPSPALTVPGDDARVADAAAIVRELLPDARIEVRAAGPPRHRRGYDREGAAREIGFRPAYGLREGLRRTVAALRERRGLPPPA